MQQTAQKFSDREALVNTEKSRRYTFKELHLLTNKICNMMQDHFSMDFGDKFIALLENDNLSLFTSWMAKGKAASGWLNYRDSFEEHKWQIELLQPKVIFMETVLVETYHEALRAMGIQIVCMDKMDKDLEGVSYFWDLLEDARDDELNVEYDIDEHVFLYRFTGGTTGTGKCAAYSLRNLLTTADLMDSFHEPIVKQNSRHIHMAPISHASVIFVLPLFFKGGTNITMNVPDLTNLCEIIQAEKATLTFLVPTLLYWLVDSGLNNAYDLSSLETIVYGAAPMSPTKLIDLQEAFGNIFIQAYGSTESLPPATILGKSAHVVNSPEDKKTLSSMGQPCPRVEIKICDDDGQEVADNETGEIYIRSDGTIKGYYQNPEKTKEEFVDGFWKSGDMGYRDDNGYIYIVDRKKDMIISGGFNVYAIEVENTLNSHPAVQQSAVVGIPHEEWGEAVHGEIILSEGTSVTEQELIDFCKERIGRYKAPKTISFVDQLPMTAVGKVIRRQVRDKYWSDSERKV